MTTSYRRSCLVALVMLLCCYTLGAQAQQTLAEQASTRDEAASLVLADQDASAKVIGVRERKDKRGNTWFEVKLLNNGKIQLFRVDKH